jgi:predicted CopG family antitoxin
MAKIIKKKKAPSRVRYEQAHPTVSCRVAKELYDRLKAVKKTEGRSFADILKIGLGVLEVQVKKEEEVKKKAHTEGYRTGYAEAERLYKVTYLCAICRKPLVVTTTDEKEAIKTYMREHGWRHRACQERGG